MTGSGFATKATISVAALTSYTKVDTEECICPVDGVGVVDPTRKRKHEEVIVNDGKFATAVLEDEVVTLS